MFKDLEKIIHSHLESSKAAVQLATDELERREEIIRDLFQNPRLPEIGLDELTIEYILNVIAKMDSNNLSGNLGMGEREGRVFSSIISRRHFNLSHGIGRSGEITESQPKAIGSSFLYRMTNCLVKHAITTAGLHKRAIEQCLVLPVATGMAITLCLIGIRRFLGPEISSDKKFVLLIRCDQKSALKAIRCAGFEPVIVENRLDQNDIVTDAGLLEKVILDLSPENVFGVISTTSCFAPRLPDKYYYFNCYFCLF